MSTISASSAKRLVKDIKDITNRPLCDEGIFYKHDDAEMLKGYAMIIGPEYGLYANGFYFFIFNFPTDYPFSPPIVEYCTNDGSTRFNPNLYRQGKVCLSILNTWSGDSWTACQTIRSVLLQLLLLFNDKPLLNEPGVTESHADYINYNTIIQYKNISYSIYLQFVNNSPLLLNRYFKDEIKQHIQSKINDIHNTCKKLKEIYPKSRVVKTKLYNMSTIIDYNQLTNKIDLLKQTF